MRTSGTFVSPPLEPGKHMFQKMGARKSRQCHALLELELKASTPRQQKVGSPVPDPSETLPSRTKPQLWAYRPPKSGTNPNPRSPFHFANPSPTRISLHPPGHGEKNGPTVFGTRCWALPPAQMFLLFCLYMLTCYVVFTYLFQPEQTRRDASARQFQTSPVGELCSGNPGSSTREQLTPKNSAPFYRNLLKEPSLGSMFILVER